jgi:hypothetical protein
MNMNNRPLFGREPTLANNRTLFQKKTIKPNTLPMILGIAVFFFLFFIARKFLLKMITFQQ